jgi:CYTH domain-containing protein
MIGSVPNPEKYAHVEEERRFLLDKLPDDLDITAFSRIVDYYLVGTSLRLRRIESSAGEVIVYKFGQKFRAAEHAPHQTMMTNIYLDEAEYLTLARLGGAQLTKRRYRYEHADLDYSIDVFEDHLEGLILAEIEGDPGREITHLPIPPFVVREVTDDLKFTGGVLVELSEDDFQRWMKIW